MPPSDGEIDTRAEAIRNLQMAENELAGHPNLAKAVRIEMHTRIAAVWCALTSACAESVRPAAQAPPGARVLPEETTTRLWEATAEPEPVSEHRLSPQDTEYLRQSCAESGVPGPTHTPGQQWRDTSGDVWTAVGYLDRGDVLVVNGDPDDMLDWPDVSPIAELDIYTFNHVWRKWGPLDEIQPPVDKETTGE